MVTVPPQGVGRTLLYTSIVLLVITWCTFITRVGVRIRINAFGLDDYAMAAGIMLFTVIASLFIVCSFYGAGQPDAVLPHSTMMKGIKLTFIGEYFYAAATTSIKCSIAITLLRIAGNRRRFTWIIWSVMTTSFLSSIVFIIGITHTCTPLITLWGDAHGSCNIKLNIAMNFFFSCVEIAMAWTLAILPIALLWNVKLKKRIRFSVALILGMAAVASCASIVRLYFLFFYSNNPQFMLSTGQVGLWTVIETGIAIIAGSLPALRPLLSPSFPSLYGSRTDGDNSSPTGNAYSQPRTSRYYVPKDVTLDTFQQVQNKDDENDENDGESEKQIFKETQVTMTHEEAGPPAEWNRTQVLGREKDNDSS